MSESQDKVIAEGKHIRLVARGKWEFAERKKVSGIVLLEGVICHGTPAFGCCDRCAICILVRTPEVAEAAIIARF